MSYDEDDRRIQRRSAEDIHFPHIRDTARMSYSRTALASLARLGDKPAKAALDDLMEHDRLSMKLAILIKDRADYFSTMFNSLVPYWRAAGLNSLQYLDLACQLVIQGITEGYFIEKMGHEPEFAELAWIQRPERCSVCKRIDGHHSKICSAGICRCQWCSVG